MSRPAVIGLTLAGIALLFIPARSAHAEKSAADLLPASTSAYVEISQPKDVIGLILDHSLRKEVEQSEAFTKATSTPDYLTFQAVLSVVEARIGMKWRPALETLTGGGFVLAYDPKTKSVTILIKPRDAKAAEKIRDTVFGLVRDDAQKKGGPDPIVAQTYRKLNSYQLGDAIVENLGEWVVFCEHQALAREVADRFLDGGESLAGDGDYAAARKLGSTGPAPTVWTFFRLDALRKNLPPGIAPKTKSENPVLEFLAGGLAPAIQKAPFVTVSAWLDAHSVKLSVATPHDAAWVPAERKFFFASPGSGATKSLMPKDTLLSITTYRDFAAMWQSGPDLFSESVATKMAQADSGISTFFGGMSFSSEVLGAIKPQIQFVVARQDYKVAGVREPAIRLPGGALVLSVKPEQFEKLSRHFRIAFQSLVAFVNLDAGQKGRALLEMKSETRGGAEIQYATYSAVDEDTAKKPREGGKGESAALEDIYLNFSPALVMSKKHVVLCSTRQLAEDLADLLAKPDADTTIPENTLIQFGAQSIAHALGENREQLIANDMLEKGHDRATSQKQIDLLVAIVNAFHDASIRLVPTDQAIHLDVELKLSN